MPQPQYVFILQDYKIFSYKNNENNDFLIYFFCYDKTSLYTSIILDATTCGAAIDST